jgi:hypothetical protein
MWEERAIVLGRLGQHLQALSIYVCVLRDHEAAEEYARKHYVQNDEKHKQVLQLNNGSK